MKKLKASKLKDLDSLADQVKDAYIIIIHSGKNNIPGKDSTADSGKSILECITSFREAVPEENSSVKVIPIGDHETGSETPHYTQHHGDRDTNGLDKHNERGGINQRPYTPMNNGNGQYRQQHYHPEGRDQRYSIDRGYQPPMYQGNLGLVVRISFKK